MKNIIYHYMGILCLVLLGGLSACKEETVLSGQAERVPITLAGEIDQLALTRVDDGGFCDGDVMGVYVIDYQGNVPGILQDAGNRATNVKHTFDEAAYRWDAAYDIYWKDEHTPVDIYGYYPFASPGMSMRTSLRYRRTSRVRPKEGHWEVMKPVISFGEKPRRLLRRRRSSVCHSVTA